MMDDPLLPGWRERIESARGAGPALPLPPPLARDYLAGRVHFVRDRGGARALVQAAYESPVTCVGIDTEYRFERDHPIRLRGDSEWYDIRSVRPFCLAFAIISEDRLLRFVVDLRVASLLTLVQEVLDLPVPFACHQAKAELFALWSLGLREPRLVWDTMLAEKALRLGRCPLRRGPAGPRTTRRPPGSSGLPPPRRPSPWRWSGPRPATGSRSRVAAPRRPSNPRS